MGFEGHVFDMISRSRQNREILRSRHERVRKIREMYLTHYDIQTSKSQAPVDSKAIKEEIRRKLQKKRQKAWMLTGGIIIIVIAAFLYWILAYHPWEAFSNTFIH